MPSTNGPAEHSRQLCARQFNSFKSIHKIALELEGLKLRTPLFWCTIKSRRELRGEHRCLFTRCHTLARPAKLANRALHRALIVVKIYDGGQCFAQAAPVGPRVHLNELLTGDDVSVYAKKAHGIIVISSLGSLTSDLVSVKTLKSRA